MRNGLETNTTLETNARTVLARYISSERGARVLVGFSGGADSTALLHWLITQKEEWKLTVAAAHVNHTLRGTASDADAAFAEAFCAEYGIQLYSKKVDCAGYAQEKKIGQEAAGRTLRYRCFAEIAARENYTFVALAHTLSDRIETFFMNTGRGAGLPGLCSIPPARPLGQGLTVIRPLISSTRTDVESYCAAHELKYRTDESNADLHMTRNRVRHCLMPVFKEIFPGAESSMARMFALLEAENTVLQTQADALTEDAVLRHRALRRILAEKGLEASMRQVLLADVPQAWTMPLDPTDLQKKRTLPDGRVCETEILELEPEKFKKNLQLYQETPLSSLLDYDTINGDIFITNRRQGDSLHTVRGIGEKSVRKIFQERGIPPEERSCTVFLRDAKGIVWMEGVGAAHRCRVQEPTRRLLTVRITRRSG